MSTAASPSTASASDVLRWRMQALKLTTGSAGDSVTDTVRHLAALQGQDWNASLWAVGVRTPATTRADVAAAMNAGEVVRSWPMRGTVHLVAAEDLRWIQRLTEKRVLAGVAKRRAYLGLDDATVTCVIDTTMAALSGGLALSRDELAAAWLEAGIDAPGQWRYHLIWYMSQTGLIVQGPVADAGGLGRTAEPLWVGATEWIRAPRTLDGDEALTELATCFTRGRGVVQVQDLAWWAGIGKREVARGFQAAGDALVPLEVDGVQYWADAELMGREVAGDSGTLLLPGFDEHLLGFTDRALQLDATHFERIVPGRNGVFRATVVRDGRVVGTWRAKQLKTRSALDVEPFPGARISPAELSVAASRWAEFHGAPAVEISVSS